MTITPHREIKEQSQTDKQFEDLRNSSPETIWSEYINLHPKPWGLVSILSTKEPYKTWAYRELSKRELTSNELVDMLVAKGLDDYQREEVWNKISSRNPDATIFSRILSNSLYADYKERLARYGQKALTFLLNEDIAWGCPYDSCYEIVNLLHGASTYDEKLVPRIWSKAKENIYFTHFYTEVMKNQSIDMGIRREALDFVLSHISDVGERDLADYLRTDTNDKLIDDYRKSFIASVVMDRLIERNQNTDYLDMDLLFKLETNAPEPYKTMARTLIDTQSRRSLLSSYMFILSQEK